MTKLEAQFIIDIDEQIYSLNYDLKKKSIYIRKNTEKQIAYLQTIKIKFYDTICRTNSNAASNSKEIPNNK